MAFGTEICTGWIMSARPGPARPGPARWYNGPARYGPRARIEFMARSVSASCMPKPGPAVSKGFLETIQYNDEFY